MIKHLRVQRFQALLLRDRFDGVCGCKRIEEIFFDCLQITSGLTKSNKFMIDTHERSFPAI